MVIQPSWSETALASEDVLDALSDAILIINPDKIICWANVAAEDLFRLSRARLLNMPLVDLLREDHPIIALLNRHIVEATTTMARDIYLRPLNTENTHILDVQIMPLRGDDERTRYILTLREKNMDILRSWDEHLKGENTLELMGSVLGHEIRNPLAGIRGSAQLLSLDLNDENKQLTDIIIEEVDRINRFISQLQDADLSKSDFKSLNIHKALNTSIRNFRSQFGDNFHIIEEFDPSLPDILGHEDSLIRLFINIARNAAESLPEKNGRITFRSYWYPGVRFRQSSDTSSSMPLIVEIEDNGFGIPKRLQNRIFEPFVTTKKAGNGLGLALSEKIMNEHHGIIECDSKEGRTIFRMRFPIYQRPHRIGNKNES